jgi:hypothetical protein
VPEETKSPLPLKNEAFFFGKVKLPNLYDGKWSFVSHTNISKIKFMHVRRECIYLLHHGRQPPFRASFGVKTLFYGVRPFFLYLTMTCSNSRLWLPCVNNFGLPIWINGSYQSHLVLLVDQCILNYAFTCCKQLYNVALRLRSVHEVRENRELKP